MRSCPPHSSPSASVSSVLTVADLTLVRLNPSLATKLGVSLAVVLLHTNMAVAQQMSVSEPASSSPAQVSTTTTNRQQLLFVNPIVGHDVTGDGSQRSPFRTITHALQRAEPNTVIMLAAGTYSAETGEVFPLQLKPDTTIQGDPSTQGRGITIRGGGAFTSADSIEQNVTILAADRAQLIGVTVSNPNAQGYGLWTESSTALIANNTFTSSQSQSISTSGDRLAGIQNNRFARSRAAETTSAAQSGASQSGSARSRSSQVGVQTVQQSAAITDLPPATSPSATSAMPTITTPPPLVSRSPSSPAYPPVTHVASAGNWQSLRYSTPVTTSPSQPDRQISVPPPVVSPAASAADGEIVPIAAPMSTVSTPSSAATPATATPAIATRSQSISSTPAVQIAVMPPVQSTRSNRASSSRETPTRENRSIPARSATRTVASASSPAVNSVTAPAIAISVPPPVTTVRQTVQPFAQSAAQPQRSFRSNPAGSDQPTSTQPPALTPIAAPTATTAIEIPVPPPETAPNVMLAYAAPSSGFAPTFSAPTFSAPIEIPVPLPESSAIPPTLAPSQAISPPKVSATVTAAATGDLLPVPTGDIPIGNVGDMPRVSVAGTPSPWGSGAQLASSYARASLRYRVVVDASSERTQSLVQSIVPDAFLTSIGGQSLMQVGAFSDRVNAEQAVQRLTQNGLVAVIQEIE
jgi:hypothetical protein